MVESDTMEYRYVGNSGLKVSVLGFGFGNVTSDISADSEQWSYECIDKCIRAGINFLDTAELYGMGESEEILGSTLKQGGWDREELVITTKFHPRCFGIQGLARKRCRQALDNSLKRLQLDYVDIVYLHRFDPSTPLEESIRLMNKLIDDEKTFY